MSASSSYQTMIPSSADIKYKTLKFLGGGMDGVAVLAVPKSGEQNLDSCIALKILIDDKTTSVSKELLIQLKGMQSKEDHLIAAVYDYQPIELPEWHCMAYIPGCSIEQLLKRDDFQDGMSPTVILHVLSELIRVQEHLRANKLTHTDLGAGGNVMLSNNGNDAWPCVTLVDFSGILSYSKPKEAKNVFQLVSSMTMDQEAVPECWKLSTFQAHDVTTADEVYKECNRLQYSWDEELLQGLWEFCREKTKGLKQRLRDDVALQKLSKVLDTAGTTEQDVERLVKTPEYTMEVQRFDATSK